MLATALVLTTLAACRRAEQEPVEAQRIAFDKVPTQGEEPLASPDTKDANWTTSANGQSLDFGNPGARPFVSLECSAGTNPPQITIVRHAPARAGEKALFPVIGNGKIARFAVDAVHIDNEWRWQGTLPADDAQLDVFSGARPLEATLPGGGTVKIEGSGAPGQFIATCRGRRGPPA